MPGLALASGSGLGLGRFFRLGLLGAGWWLLHIGLCVILCKILDEASNFREFAQQGLTELGEGVAGLQFRFGV